MVWMTLRTCRCAEVVSSCRADVQSDVIAPAEVLALLNLFFAGRVTLVDFFVGQRFAILPARVLRKPP
jgi:hypothetical protein